jgi:hypothetical protein
MSVMTYACPTWGHTADVHLLKLQHLQNRALHAIEVLTGAHQCILEERAPGTHWIGG